MVSPAKADGIKHLLTNGKTPSLFISSAATSKMLFSNLTSCEPTCAYVLSSVKVLIPDPGLEAHESSTMTAFKVSREIKNLVAALFLQGSLRFNKSSNWSFEEDAVCVKG